MSDATVDVNAGGSHEEPTALIPRKFGNNYDPTDPQWGAIGGGKTGNDTTDLLVAQTNRAAFQACGNAFTAAVLAGDRRATFRLPGKDFLIATAPYIGSGAGSAGVSATGGAHYRGSTGLPLSFGWSCHGLVFDGLTGGRLVGDGGRLIRIENDPYNTSSSFDDTNSTILIVRSSDWTMEGFWDHEGYQNDSAIAATAPTSGSFIDVSYGCKQFSIAALIRSWKHANALAVGMNRNTAFGGGGIDILQPCTDWEIGNVEAYVGNHAAFINVADQWSIRSIRHGFKPYTYGGVTQSDYVQRTLYLLSCGKGEVGRVQSSVGQKAQVLLTAYPSTRAYKDLDVYFGAIDLTAQLNQDADFNCGVEINDQNDSIGTLRRVAVTIGQLKTRGHKIGLNYRDDNGVAITGKSILTRLEIATIDIQATGAGISLTPNGSASNIKLGRGRVYVHADAAYSATTMPITGMKISSVKGAADGMTATDFISNVTIGQLDVVSGNRAGLLQAIDGLTITGASFAYDAQGVPNAQTYDLRVDYCRNFGTIDYRLANGGRAIQSTFLEQMPNPIRGYYTRTEARNPGALPAGGSSASAWTMNGVRAGMGVTVEIVSPPGGVIATASITADDVVMVVTRNLSNDAVPAGTLNYAITVTVT